MNYFLPANCEYLTKISSFLTIATKNILSLNSFLLLIESTIVEVELKLDIFFYVYLCLIDVFKFKSIEYLYHEKCIY